MVFVNSFKDRQALILSLRIILGITALILGIFAYVYIEHPIGKVLMMFVTMVEFCFSVFLKIPEDKV